MIPSLPPATESALPWEPRLRAARVDYAVPEGMGEHVSWRDLAVLWGMSRQGARDRVELALRHACGSPRASEQRLRAGGAGIRIGDWLLWVSYSRRGRGQELRVHLSPAPEGGGGAGWRECLSPLCVAAGGKRKVFWSKGFWNRFCPKCAKTVSSEHTRLVRVAGLQQLM